MNDTLALPRCEVLRVGALGSLTLGLGSLFPAWAQSCSMGTTAPSQCAFRAFSEVELHHLFRSSSQRRSSNLRRSTIEKKNAVDQPMRMMPLAPSIAPRMRLPGGRTRSP